mmetsp:Transcript_57306/g.179537  ORF Transcript_57306/g.179537 Transcript_57306/m.179537 type:complete len:216 (-) Transcript_57306:62-709(-)
MVLCPRMCTATSLVASRPTPSVALSLRGRTPATSATTSWSTAQRNSDAQSSLRWWRGWWVSSSPCCPWRCIGYTRTPSCTATLHSSTGIPATATTSRCWSTPTRSGPPSSAARRSSTARTTRSRMRWSHGPAGCASSTATSCTRARRPLASSGVRATRRPSSSRPRRRRPRQGSGAPPPAPEPRVGRLALDAVDLRRGEAHLAERAGPRKCGVHC